MHLPLDDWQFWVTSIAAIVAIVFVARTVLPRRRKARRTNITVGGKKI